MIISIGLIFYFMLKITELAKPQIKIAEKSQFSLHDVIEVKVLAVSFVALLTAFAYSSIMSFITLFSETKQLLAYTGIFFIVFAASMLLVRPWVGKIYDRKGPSAVIYPSLFFLRLA